MGSSSACTPTAQGGSLHEQSLGVWVRGDPSSRAGGAGQGTPGEDAVLSFVSQLEFIFIVCPALHVEVKREETRWE